MRSRSNGFLIALADVDGSPASLCGFLGYCVSQRRGKDLYTIHANSSVDLDRIPREIIDKLWCIERNLGIRVVVAAGFRQ
jgi:hypothetical protein